MKARFEYKSFPDIEHVPSKLRALVIQITLDAVAYKAEYKTSEPQFAHYMRLHARTMRHELSGPAFKEAQALLPMTYKGALSMLSKETSLVWNNQIHYQMCVACDLVYRCKHLYLKDADFCLCGTARTKENTKTLIYMPLSGHLRNIYGVPSYAKALGEWADRRSKVAGRVNDSTDLINPWNYDPALPQGKDNEPRHVMLTHIQDPFQPFKDDAYYSCSPGLVHILNFPGWARQEEGCAHVLSIGPGSRKRTAVKLKDNIKKTDQHQHAIFADELQWLDKHGIEVYDAHRKEYFYCKARLVNCISDLRGMEKLIGISSTPKRCGCLHCWIEGFKVGGKTLYTGHQAFLDRDDPLRQVLFSRNKEAYLVSDTPAQRAAKDQDKPVLLEPPLLRTEMEARMCSARARPQKVLVDGEDDLRQLGEWVISKLGCRSTQSQCPQQEGSIPAGYTSSCRATLFKIHETTVHFVLRHENFSFWTISFVWIPETLRTSTLFFSLKPDSGSSCEAGLQADI